MTQRSRALHCVSSLAYLNWSTFNEMAPPYETKIDPFQMQSRLFLVSEGALSVKPLWFQGNLSFRPSPCNTLKTETELLLFPHGQVHVKDSSVIWLPETKTKLGSGVHILHVWSTDQMWFICQILRNGREKPQEELSTADGGKNSVISRWQHKPQSGKHRWIHGGKSVFTAEKGF